MALNQAISQLDKLVGVAKTILVLQPEKPDTDSLGSALALEALLSELGKTVIMYCQDEIPEYIRLLPGWDRVTDEFPAKFDLTILVDTGGPQMLERTLEKHAAKLSSQPFAIIDHHKTREPLPFPTLDVIDPDSAATGELLAKIAQQLQWPLGFEAARAITPAILADTLGLATPTTTADTVQTVADMVRLGVDLYELRRLREIAGALTPELLNYRGQLFQRIEYHCDGRLALIIIPPEELRRWAKIHAPADLVIQDMRIAKGVDIAAVISNYPSELNGRKVKISFRANLPIAAQAAQAFGGGGHDQAAGCTIQGGNIDEIKPQLIKVVGELLQNHAAA